MLCSRPLGPGARGYAMTFPRQIQIDVGLPSQDCLFVTPESVQTHVRMQVAPVIVGSSRVVTDVVAFVGGMVVMADRSDIRINGQGRGHR